MLELLFLLKTRLKPSVHGSAELRGGGSGRPLMRVYSKGCTVPGYESPPAWAGRTVAADDEYVAFPPRFCSDGFPSLQCCPSMASVHELVIAPAYPDCVLMLLFGQGLGN